MIQQAFNAAVVPTFNAVAPPTLTQADLPIFYIVPFGPILRLLGESNTDDDYGHWDVIFWSQNGVVGCKAVGGTAESHANPAWCVIGASSKTQLVLSYVDDNNDIDCVIDVTLAYSDPAAIKRALLEEQKKEEARRNANGANGRKSGARAARPGRSRPRRVS